MSPFPQPTLHINQMQMERNTSSLNCTSTKTRRNGFPTRSNNFPSRPHPIVQEIDEHLCRLRSSEATSTSSTSISQKLSGLQDLHDSVETLLQYQLPLTQQALAQAQNEKCSTEVLGGSLSPWMFVEVQRMPFRKPRNVFRTFNQS